MPKQPLDKEDLQAEVAPTPFVGRGKFDNRYYVKCYELARSGLSESRIADALGVGSMTLNTWKRKYPALRDALKLAKKRRKEGELDTFRNFVYSQLPEDLKELWNQINKVDEDQSGVAKVEALLENRGKYARQHLFLYALTTCNFNPSEAMRKMNMPKSMLDKWINEDLDFKRLVDEILWHKKNFIEGGLMRLVQEGDSPAVIFANKTLNKDRGYGEKTGGDINIHNTKVDINVITLDELNSLGLSIECRAEILAALRKKKEQAELPKQSSPIPIEHKDFAVKVLQETEDKSAIAIEGQ